MILLLNVFLFACKTKKNATNSSNLNLKYSQKLGLTVNSAVQNKLFEEVIPWLGTPYKLGGNAKNGVDCSGLVEEIFRTTYAKNTPRTTSELFDSSKKIDTKDLQQGDLVFFKLESKKISHVGIYLQENKFVHATIHKGVMVNDLNETYYKKGFYKAGRFK